MCIGKVSECEDSHRRGLDEIVQDKGIASNTLKRQDEKMCHSPLLLRLE